MNWDKFQDTVVDTVQHMKNKFPDAKKTKFSAL